MAWHLMRQVILFPSTNSYWALLGVVLVDTIAAALQLRVLRKCVVSDRRLASVEQISC